MVLLPIGLPIKLPIELPIVARLDPAWFPPVSPGLAGQGRLGWGRGWALPGPLGSGVAGGGRWPSDTMGVALTVCNLGLLQYCC